MEQSNKIWCDQDGCYDTVKRWLFWMQQVFVWAVMNVVIVVIAEIDSYDRVAAVIKKSLWYGPSDSVSFLSDISINPVAHICNIYKL